MIETIILLKPHNEWRAGKTKSDIIDEINNKLQIPGFTQPIINRINMLSTGIRTDVCKIYGASLDTIEALAQKLKDAGRDRRSERFVCRANNWWEVYRY
jgi:Cu(I)/Ag(I) efflux system membrane protein CusA/SilA